MRKVTEEFRREFKIPKPECVIQGTHPFSFFSHFQPTLAVQVVSVEELCTFLKTMCASAVPRLFACRILKYRPSPTNLVLWATNSV
jgi:hypothetical protein